jgi:hypothetical protein
LIRENCSRKEPCSAKLLNIFQAIRDFFLEKEAENFLNEDGFFYRVRVLSAGGLYKLIRMISCVSDDYFKQSKTYLN